MRFEVTTLPGVMLIEPDARHDERGLFSRTFCKAEFAAHGLPDAFAQCSVSYSERRGTLRGMHWQDEPAAEGKLIRCTRGAIRDVALDLRPESATYLRWCAFDLTEDNLRQVYIPPGFAHGLQTLVDRCEVHYSITVPYAPALQRGARWNDPAFGIDWPIVPPIVAPRDADFPDWRP